MYFGEQIGEHIEIDDERRKKLLAQREKVRLGFIEL